MKKNHIVEILLTIFSIVFILIAFNATIDKYFVAFDFGTEHVFAIDNATQNIPFPAYEHENAKQTFNDNYAIGLPPAIAPIGLKRAAHNYGTANAISNTRMPSYSVNAIAESAPTNAGSAFGGMQAMAFLSTSKGRASASDVGARSLYTSTFANNTGFSKVPFSANTPNDVILVDPKTDPVEENRIPIGQGEYVFLILGLLYVKRIAMPLRLIKKK